MSIRKVSWSTQYAKNVLLQTLAQLRGGQLELVCPRETHLLGDESGGARATLVVQDERVFTRVLCGGDVGLGEAYMDGDWSSPNLVAVLQLMVRNLPLFDERNRGYALLRRMVDWLGHLRRANSQAGSRRNIAHHYDLGNEFYRLFLDRSMAYSCGYFRRAEDSLEQAQRQKFDRICRKLRLGPRDHVLEIGTGWGGFAVHAATQYGCRVTTTTISSQQHAYAREWLARTGLLGERVQLLLEDYRNLRGRFDKIVSIEMFEAVGLANYDTYFRACDRLLAPDGSMLLQTITFPDQKLAAYRGRADWIQKYIFPGAELAAVGEILRSLQRATQMTLFHAEDIGLHYAYTLRAWRERFLDALPQVRALSFDDRFIRMWDFYLASCEAAFLERDIGDFQLLLTKTLNPRPLMEEPWDKSFVPSQSESAPRAVLETTSSL